jgi:hypothetical protein
LVALFALFVGVQVARRSALPAGVANRAANAAAEFPRDPVTADVASSVLRGSGTPPPNRDLDEIRARIAGATDSYMPAMLGDLKGMLVRWPDRTARPLRIWVQSGAALPGFDSRFEQLARDAFSDWQDGALPLRFDFVFDSATSDIHVTWTDRFPPSRGLQVGSTQRATDQYGWIVAANMVVAVHDSAGDVLRTPEMAGIVRHEAGHALGLGHSRSPETLMYPSERVTEIRSPDRATLRLLYALPPGPIP